MTFDCNFYNGSYSEYIDPSVNRKASVWKVLKDKSFFFINRKTTELGKVKKRKHVSLSFDALWLGIGKHGLFRFPSLAEGVKKNKLILPFFGTIFTFLKIFFTGYVECYQQLIYKYDIVANSNVLVE